MTLLDICTGNHSKLLQQHNDCLWSPLSMPPPRMHNSVRWRRRGYTVKDCDLLLRAVLPLHFKVLTATILAILLLVGGCDLWMHRGSRHARQIRADDHQDDLLMSHSETAGSTEVHFIGGSPNGMPLFEETPQLFPTAAFALIQQALTSNSSLLAPFGRKTGRVGTKSRTLVFNVEGLARLRGEAQYTEATLLFDRLRDREANAWVMRLIASESCPGFKANEGVWAIHRDELPSNNAARDVFLDPVNHLVRISPLMVHVLDVASPAMLGGELWVWSPGDEWPTISLPPAAVLPHRSNTLFTIRGDSFHGLNGHNSSIPGPRVSIELEQYKVPPHLYAQTMEWEVRSASTEFRAKRPPGPPHYQPSSPEQRAVAAALLQGTQAGSRSLARIEEPQGVHQPSTTTPPSEHASKNALGTHHEAPRALAAKSPGTGPTRLRSTAPVHVAHQMPPAVVS